MGYPKVMRSEAVGEQSCREQCRTYPQADECLIYRLQNIHDMEIKIENILILWDEKVTDIFVSLINTLSLSFSETEIRNSMAKLSENENFGRLFAYGFGAHHLWVAQRMITDLEKVMENRLLIVEF